MYVCICTKYLYIECLNIHGIHVTINNSIKNNVEFFFVSDLKIVYYNNYQFLIKMPWIREENILRHDLYGDKNH